MTPTNVKMWVSVALWSYQILQYPTLIAGRSSLVIATKFKGFLGPLRGMWRALLTTGRSFVVITYS